MSAAFVFPGQGSQYVGMGRQLAAAYAVAREAFGEADEALGEDLSRLAWEGDSAELDRTGNAQPAILATSIALMRALGEVGDTNGEAPPRPAYFAGHSMGQYSAMVAAGVLTLADGVRLVRERGRLMQASSDDGAMAAILGLPEEHVPAVAEAGARAGVVTIANRNAPGQIVISGERRAVDTAIEEAKVRGAKRAMPLAVSVAAHSPLMAAAAEGMRGALATVPFGDPSAPLLANADARSLATGEACRAELIEHLTRGVDWVAVVQAMSGAGVTTFVEVGPGKVLTGLIKRIVPDADAFASDDPKADDGLARPTYPAPASA